jgi:low temperature requirement protein LtrA
MTDARVLPDGREKRHASWLELFYDLLFVALFAQLAHGLVADPGLGTTFKVLGFFAPAWWAWVSYTVSSNLFGESGPGHRVLVLLNMGCLLLMTAGVASGLDGDVALYANGFAASRVVMLVLVAAWQLAHPDDRPPSASYICYSVSAVLWAVSIPLGTPGAYGLWAVSIGVELVIRIREQIGVQPSVGAVRFDIELLVERFGLLVIVALGEGVVQIAAAMAQIEPSSKVVMTGLAGFGILASLWSSYFDFASANMTVAFEDARVDPDPRHRAFALVRDVFVFGHFALVGAVLAASAGLGAIVGAAVTDTDFTGDLRLLCDALVVYVLVGAAISIRVTGEATRMIAGTLPCLAALAVVAAFADHFSPAVSLATVLAIMIAGRLGPDRP